MAFVMPPDGRQASLSGIMKPRVRVAFQISYFPAMAVCSD